MQEQIINTILEQLQKVWIFTVIINWKNLCFLTQCLPEMDLKRITNWKGTYQDELVHEKEKFKAISDELDQTFAEMSGY